MSKVVVVQWPQVPSVLQQQNNFDLWARRLKIVSHASIVVLLPRKAISSDLNDGFSNVTLARKN